MVVLVVVLTRDGRQEVAPGQLSEAPRASPAEAAAALTAFVDAVETRDAQALAQLAPPQLPAADELLSDIAANVRSLDLAAVDARYVDQVGAVAPDGSWSGVAELTWRVRGFDEAPARSDVVVSFAPSGDGLGIVEFASSDAAGTRLPLWLRGRLSVSRSDDVLVMADGPPSVAKAAAARTVRGIDVVRRVLPDWSSPVVVEVPATAAALDETLGARPGTYAGIAAVTAPVGRASDGDGPVHVFVNPDVSDGLRRVGAQVVMSHELVHVATDAVRKPVEPWLLEGFADYVALRGTRLPDRVTLGRAIAAARRDGVPDALPTAADFDTRTRDLQARYEEAWLACRIIAERLGEEGLVQVYDDASSQPVTEALAAAGLPVGALSHTWQEVLRKIAR
ncbi:hypothetical protein IEZ26_20370 [Nocardioides cavernae]|uniref:Peptidase MA-like domain-containing protein n=1 Tax=Nocardioides cavernae TaxID=1921566 RepID=A0ABR8NFU5_9ACTN|nr:hypothetical protein [Nocardioides cavernae]MBD3926987.1 hypothetical protein [Nocardioides cavernae]MBM7512707.1 hypothetical protein [Nocardioides cavernae]